jgi:CRP/FNR family cyclic AMP-dependent transcriptional regulator
MESLERILAEHPFFSDLPGGHTALVEGCASNVRFEAGTYVCREGEEANHFYLLRRGRVALEISAPQRKPIIIGTLDAGDILGWSWLVPPYQWRFNARAVETTVAIALDGKCLRAKCDANHDLGYELLKRFSVTMVRRLELTRFQLLDVYAASK